MDYKLGDFVIFRPTHDQPVGVTITDKRRGDRPGFVGRTTRSRYLEGYDDQIVWIRRKPTP